VKLFCIVILGSTSIVNRKQLSGTIDTVACYQAIFGENFWKNACIIATHYSNEPSIKDQREQDGQNKSTRAAQIQKLFEEMFPSVKTSLKIYFCDTKDLGQTYDVTTSELFQISQATENILAYDLKTMRNVLCHWREHRNQVLALHRKLIKNHELGEYEFARYT
jgi:hypothetical protein